jgi:xanthine dehydrogenase accessory factor
MHDWCATLAAELATGRAIVMVTVVEVLGSAPCAPGSKLLVSPDRLWGTVGGGNLEYTAIEQARKLTQSDRASLLQSLPLGPVLSQCCGGRVTLLYERLTADDGTIFARAEQNGGRFETQVNVEDYSRRYVPKGGASVLAGSMLAHGIWHEPVHAERRQIVIFGGGHIGKALVQVLGQAPCDLVVVDPRTEVRAELSDQVAVRTDDSAEQIEAWWKASSIAIILTHSHELDYRWTKALLQRDDVAWCGVIGSKTKKVRFLRRLRDDGIAEARIAQLVCPIGLPGLNSKHPGLVAISVAAQILTLLASLSHARRGQSCECALPATHSKEIAYS